MATKISVVICTRDREDLIGQALESVAQCEYPDFDVHVMDQSTSDGTANVVRAVADRMRDRCRIVYHHLDKAGLSRAYNAGFSVSDGPIVACTDDDVVVPSDWLRCIARAFDADAQLGLLYGQVLVPESLRDAGPDVIVPSLTWTTRERLCLRDRNFKVWGMGADMAIRRRMLDSVTGFDEVMGGGAPLRSSQDFDFALRAYRAGFAVLLDPDVAVDHYGAHTRDQWPGTEKAYGIGDGAFYAKHIRCRDLLAARLLVMHAARLVAKAGYSTVRNRRPVGLGVYGTNLFAGLWESRKWSVDRRRRLYVANDDRDVTVTAANAVAGAQRT
jgi:glycosyltransferase involved in cell wall biosynthesis